MSASPAYLTTPSSLLCNDDDDNSHTHCYIIALYTSIQTHKHIDRHLLTGLALPIGLPASSRETIALSSPLL